MDDQVDQRLKNNPKVRVSGEMYAYQAKYDMKNRLQLLRILERVSIAFLTKPIVSHSSL